MGLYSDFEKIISNICSKGKLTRTISVLLIVFFLGVIIGVCILPTMLGALIGGILGIIGAFIYCFLITRRLIKQK
jgi:hypothetical protein